MGSKWRAFAETLAMFTEHLQMPLNDEGFGEFQKTYLETVGNYLTCQKGGGNGTDYWQDPMFKRWALRCVQIIADNVNEEVAKRNGTDTNKADVETGMKCAVRLIKKYYCKNLPKCKDDPSSQRGPVCELYERNRRITDPDLVC